jgi:hypothetical protein
MTSFASLCRAAVIAAMLGAAAVPAAAQIAPDAPQGQPAARDLRELIDRYMAWRGGFALESLQTIHERLQIDTPAGRQSGALWIDRDGRTRREITTADGRVVEVATPDGAWKSTAGGAPAADPGAFERDRRYALLMFGDALAGRGGASVTLAGTADVDDRTWDVVRVSFGDADTYDALLDPSGGFLCCYRITEGGVTRLERLGDWRLVDGVRMPFAELVHTSGDVGLRISAIELNRPLDPTLFARPAG